MIKKIVLLAIILISFRLSAEDIDSNQVQIDEIEKSLSYQTGTIELKEGNAKITVPSGFKFLDQEQSIYVLTDLWGNPPDSSILGMLVPENMGVLASNSWVFTISYDNMGYVKDEDADDIDYDDLLKEQQEETRENNTERIRLGYQPIEFVGWASEPYYNKTQKTLHWAKELKFGEDSISTLNYNLRVLGRKGIFLINAIASINDLETVESNIDNVISSVEFTSGNRYADFDPDIDEVAAWTVGGLVAGKVLAKVGFFALLLKFWKIIGVAIIAAFAAIKKYLGIQKDKKDEPIQRIDK